MGAKSLAIASHGMRGILIDVECQITNGLPAMIIVGSASRSIDEAKERVRNALGSSGLKFPRKRVAINLAPGDIPKDGTSLDLSIAAAILGSSDQIPTEALAKHIFIGELGLDGSVRSVRGVIGKLLSTQQLVGYTYVLPAANLPQAQAIQGISILPISNLRELYLHLTGAVTLPVITSTGATLHQTKKLLNGPDMSEVIGQRQAKRALEIAAAGGHNILLNGPPGTGKSMLAKAFTGLLPDLSPQEVLEVTHLHSLADNNYEAVLTQRPFRAPHHSASHIAITGGGQNPGPGEISLSHHGVLFMDELPEFSRPTIECLRQPLEDGFITVSRTKGSFDFPARFILVATANPCPCGYLGSTKPCDCSPSQISHYQRKLSGPILDRIDIHVTVDQVEHAKLLKTPLDAESSQVIRRRVEAARHRQLNRDNTTSLNATLTNQQIKQQAKLTPEARSLLNQAAAQLQLSARGYMRLVKVAQTIADLECLNQIDVQHISEALQYRLKQPAAT